MVNIFNSRAKRPSHYAYAVVTGAASGIGRSFALELAKRGSAVVCADMNLPAAEETAAQIIESGGNAYPVHCDVGEATQVEQLAHQSESLLGKLFFPEIVVFPLNGKQ